MRLQSISITLLVILPVLLLMRRYFFPLSMHHYHRLVAIDEFAHSFNKTFRLIQPAHISNNSLRNFEIESVYNHNRKLFTDYLRPAERSFSQLVTFSHPEKINILANADIVFDRSIEKSSRLDNWTIFALTRYEMSGHFSNRSDSQDVWIFHGTLKHSCRMNLSFDIGTAGCDNRLAWEFKSAGYNVMNPSVSIRTYHVHSTGDRTYLSSPRVPPPYLTLRPCKLDST